MNHSPRLLLALALTLAPVALVAQQGSDKQPAEKQAPDQQAPDKQAPDKQPPDKQPPDKQPPDRDLAAQVTALLKESKLDEAQTLLATSLEQHPDSRILHNRQFAVSLFLSRAGRHEEAVKQVDAYVSYLVHEIATTGAELPIAAYVERAAAAYEEAQLLETGKRRVEQWLVTLGASPHAQKSSVATARLEILGAQALLLAADHQRDAAITLIRDAVAQSQMQLANNPDEPDALINVARALMLQHRIASQMDVEQAAAAREQYAAFLDEQVPKHSENIDLLNLYGAHEVETILSMIDADLTAAEQRVQRFREFLAALDGDKPAIAAFRRSREQAVAALEGRIKTAHRHRELVGQAAIPLGEVTWLNGTPLTPDDLAGKVVLLNFWAVWCGPCISTFPDLRTWHEKYADQGLVIIGVTRHYQYGWNEESKRAERKKLTPAEEDKALLKFAAHHQLKHRFAVPEGDALMNHYDVTGIPQTVVIDQQGTVRMIRVGSGDANTEAIGSLLAELFPAEESPSAPGGSVAE